MKAMCPAVVGCFSLSEGNALLAVRQMDGQTYVHTPTAMLVAVGEGGKDWEEERGGGRRRQQGREREEHLLRTDPAPISSASLHI